MPRSIGVLDSDYVVAPDWLRCMVPAFADSRVGFVQSPQDYRDNDGSFFKRLMFWEYAGFFHLGMVTRNERNAIIQHGTMTLVRRTALEQGGGWAEWTITEDAELGLRLFRQGWQALYANRSFGQGVMPDDFAALRKQRFRWAYGATQIGRAHAGALLSPFNRDLTLGQRWHFVTGWLPWVGDALGLLFLLMGLVWSIGLIAAPMRFEFPIVLFMLPSIGLFACKLGADFGSLPQPRAVRARRPAGCGGGRTGAEPHHRQGGLEGLGDPQRAVPSHPEDGQRPGAGAGPGDGARGTAAARADLGRDGRGCGRAPAGDLGGDALVRRYCSLSRCPTLPPSAPRSSRRGQPAAEPVSLPRRNSPVDRPPWSPGPAREIDDGRQPPHAAACM